MSPRSNLSREILELLHLQRKTILGRIIQEVARRKDNCLTPSQWPLIMFLEHNEGINIKRIAQTFGISSSAATQLIDSLVKNGYAERKNDVSDRRMLMINLTRKAKNELRRIQKKAESFILPIFEHLSDNELKDYIRINRKITRAIDGNNNKQSLKK